MTSIDYDCAPKYAAIFNRPRCHISPLRASLFGPGGFIKAYRAVKKRDLFFKDKEFLDSYLSRNKKDQAELPGGYYYSKIATFIKNHCVLGEKYLEFLKFECENRRGGKCGYYKSHDLVGPPCAKVPRPYPDYSKLPEYHYHHVSNSPTSFNGAEREVLSTQ